MGIKGALYLLGLSILISSCSTDQSVQWHKIQEPQKPNIHLSLTHASLIRTEARARSDVEESVETGKWKGKVNGQDVSVWIMTYSLYDKVFTTSYSDPMSDTIRKLSGDGYLTLGAPGRFRTETGFVDYQFYKVSGLTCFYVENYWSDSSLNGVDGLRGGSVDDIIGNALLMSYYCEAGDEYLNANDLDVFLKGVYVENIYWPKDRFKKL